MDTRTRLGWTVLALSFATLGTLLGACAGLQSNDGTEGPGATGSGGDFSTGGGPVATGPSGGAGGGGGATFDSANLGGGYAANDAGGGGMENSSGAGGDGGGGGNPFQPMPPDECKNIPQNERVVYLSADDSNSMASPALARELIRMGFEPDPRSIRTYEFMNYYKFNYDAAPYGHLAIYADIEQDPDQKEVAELQIGVRAFDAFQFRRPINITIVVDTSGSMKGPGLDRAKAAVEAMGTHFQANDEITVLNWAEPPEVFGPYTITGPDDKTIQNHVNGLKAAGNTDLSSALKVAFDKAHENFDDARMNRVVFITDGGISAGIADPTYIAEQTADADKEGIYLVGVGTGPALSYNDSLMNLITDSGRGAYVYLDSVEEANNIFAKRFDEVMDIAARSVQVELTLPYYFHVKGRSTEVIAEKPVTAQHLAPGDSMTFNLETVACHSVVYSYPDEITVRTSWKTRDGYVETFDQQSFALSSLKSSQNLLKGRAIVAFANALKGCYGEPMCTETLRIEATKEKLLKAKELAVHALGAGQDDELLEIVELIDKHPLLQP